MDPTATRVDLEERLSLWWGKNDAETQSLIGENTPVVRNSSDGTADARALCSFSQHLQFEPLNGSMRLHSSTLMQYFKAGNDRLCEPVGRFTLGNAATGPRPPQILQHSCEAVLAAVFMLLVLIARWSKVQC